MKKRWNLWKFLGSMTFALILLFIILAACTAGSLIPQLEVEAYYRANYPRAAGIMLALGLVDVFHCPWFIVLTALLCVNLLLCSVLRFPQLIARTRRSFSAQARLAAWDGEPAATLKDPEPLFAQMGFAKAERGEHAGRPYRYACKNRIGLWGSWLCHLGMLVVIVGFGLGQAMQQEYSVYGVPGQEKPVGDTSYSLRIDDFAVRLREDDTVEQYEAQLTIIDGQTGEAVSGSSMVNDPMEAFGWTLYQNSTGWAATMETFKGEEHLSSTLLCAGEHARTPGNEELVVLLRAFYPDFVQDEAGSMRTKSSRLNNPAYVYMLYYGDQLLGMNALMADERISVDDYSFVFHDPQPYTLIQVKRDPFEGVAAVGALLMMVALLLAFYLHPAEIWAVQDEDGSWRIAGRSQKGGKLYQDTLRRRGAALSEKEGKDA